MADGKSEQMRFAPSQPQNVPVTHARIIQFNALHQLSAGGRRGVPSHMHECTNVGTCTLDIHRIRSMWCLKQSFYAFFHRVDCVALWADWNKPTILLRYLLYLLKNWDISVHKCVERDYKYMRKRLALPHTTDFRLKRRQIAEITVFFFLRQLHVFGEKCQELWC